MTTPIFDSPMRSVTVQIPTAVALKLSETFEGTLEDAALAGLKLVNGLGPVAYQTLHVLAKKHECTIARALRRAIDLLQEDSDISDQKLAHKPVPGRPKINETRDAEIYAQLRTGATHAVVAQAFGISLVRVGQIAAQQRLIHGDPPRGRARTPKQIKATKVHRQDTAQEEKPLSLNVPEDVPTKPRVLAVIPPSMRNPELFRKAEERPQPTPATHQPGEVDIFDDDYPLEEVFGLRGVEPGRVAYTNTPTDRK
jgi:transposase-like protein